ncbi:hypothetical protein TTHERM_000161578 (macronuclear) [Tetrahymena thermophila SB210]|uniref:Uncharacterized protein n=1 Tax=Tetrahymena thermophila (strain SB210) TaxID=312017 RepID=W7XG96_TETTS|nr:hypothetical protein TTHERM_000161578 [Tetrahymena thermophila SB210]EWS75948.1 hypothetical protein TTHERM_000161578 [Tetrahymena thermophila SB210]|eukprot:XP_012651466.1 hypothetical protein TTHERM_000161578 [Tetrahymena thermophila SB210]
MEFNLGSLEEFEQFTYEMKEQYKKLQIIFKEFGNKLQDACKDKQSQHIMNIFKENIKSSVQEFSDMVVDVSSLFQNQYTKMKEKEVYLYKQRKEYMKVYKNKQNLVKIANDQYKVSLKEIKKTNKNPKGNQKQGGESYLSEAIFYDKQRKILEKNLKQIQNAQDELDDHAAEQAKAIFEEFKESIEFMQFNQKELFKSINKHFSGLHNFVKNEILSNLEQQSKQAVQSYENTLVFRFNFNKKQRQQENDEQIEKEKRRRKSANFLYQNSNEEGSEDQSPFINRARSFINLSNISQKPAFNSQKKQISSFQSFQDYSHSKIANKRQSNMQSDIKLADIYQAESQLKSKKSKLASYSPQPSNKEKHEKRYFKQQDECEDNDEDDDFNASNNQLNQNFYLTENEISNNSKFSENSKQVRMFNSTYSPLTTSKMRQAQQQIFFYQRQNQKQRRHSQIHDANQEEHQNFQQFKQSGQQIEQIQALPNSQLKNCYSSIQDENENEFQGQNIQKIAQSYKSHKNTPVKYNLDSDQINNLMYYSQQQKVKQFNQTPNKYINNKYN